MKKIKIALITLVALLGVAVLTPSYVMADPADEIGNGVEQVGGGDETPLADRIKTIVNIFMFVLGAIAVVMIIIGGIRYVVSSGDSSQTKAAKDTILYAVVGLVVAMLAYAIVNFVIDQFK